MLFFLWLALSSAAPTTPAPPSLPAPPPPAPPKLEQNPYLSELVKARLRREMFDRPVKPKANLVSLFSTDDYPLEAMRNAEQGIVTAVIKVDSEGRVADCIIAGSSGSPSLDAQTCRIIWTRASFEPARDRQGRTVDSAFRQRIRWELPEPDPTPVKPWSARFTIEFVKDGGLIGCRMETNGALKAEEDHCDLVSDMWRAALGNLRADAGYERRTMVLDTEFQLGDQAPRLRPPVGTELFARQVAKLTIDSSGKPLQCQVIETEGQPSPVAGCDDLLADVYEKPDIRVGAIEATVVRTVYVEPTEP